MNSLKKFTGALLLAGAFAGGFAADGDIRLNSVGFLPDFPKTATVAVQEACPDCAVPFWVMRPDGGEAFSGVTGPSRRSADTGEDLLVADFSALTETGNYYISVDGIGRSPEFRIARDVFVEPYRAMMLGMYLWRCGTAVSAPYNGRTYSHAACHTNDASLKYVNSAGQDIRKDATGGWHDAGDYNKYVVNSGVSVGLMLKAWEHFRERIEAINLISVTQSGSIPAYLAEVKWNLNWVAKMQYSTDGKVSHKISTINFCGSIMPENESGTRYYVPWGTVATGSFVAMMAQAARLYAPYSPKFANDTCLARARLSYDLLANSAFVNSDQSAFKTGEYYQRDDSDKRLWAAAEMWEATGEERFLQDVENMLRPNTVKTSLLSNEITWSNVNNLGILTYLTSSRPGRDQDIVDAFNQRLITVANEIVDTANNHPYGRALGASYYWGANGTVAGMAYMLQAAYAASGDMKYLHAVQDALSHLLGRNYYGRSFVTGVGYMPPQDPHDRRSEASRTPWPGYLIGGPHNNKTSSDLASYRCASDVPAAACWKDQHGDYSTNEVAINWNTAMIYALMSANSAPASGGNPVRHTAAPRASAPAAKTTRVVRARNGRIDIPPGAKAYSLDGRLIARGGADGAKTREIRSNGVYIIKIDNNANVQNSGNKINNQ
jgi:endoglucanase